MIIRRDGGPERKIYRLIDDSTGNFARNEDGDYHDGGGFSTGDKAFVKMKSVNDDIKKPAPLPPKFRPPNMR